MLAHPSSAMPSWLAGELSLAALPSATPATSATHSHTEIRTLCEEAILALPEEAAAAKKGNKNVLNKLVGRVMKSSRGRADARGAREVLEEMLAGGG